MSMTYSEYLRVEELLKLQSPKSQEHDEMLFIVIHQVYELWFKQILHEAGHLQCSLEGNQVPAVNATLSRILEILKVMVHQIDILETLTPINFLSFRSRLESASGFQSVQFREFEFRLGHRGADRIQKLPEHAKPHLEKIMTQDSLYDSFLKMLAVRGYQVPKALTARNRAEDHKPCQEFHAELIRLYKTDSTLAAICERLVDLDEGLQEWRYRHVKMVERTIGFKRGTGGSPGAEYLRQTLFKPLFPDLWDIRTAL